MALNSLNWAPVLGGLAGHRPIFCWRLWTVLERALVILGLAALVAGVLVLHVLVLHPYVHVTVLYTLPVLVAALILRPREAALVALLAFLSYSADAWLADTPLASWAVESVTLALIAPLGIWGAEHGRAQRNLVQRLEQAQAERERLLGMVAHEIRGSLTPLSGYSQLISRSDPPSAAVMERAATAIPVQVDRLERLVTDLQDFSRIERGNFAIHPRPCDLVALVRRVAAEQQITTAKHQIRVLTDADTFPGEWDCDRLAQVFGNLLRNAINYSPQGGEVSVAVSHSDGKVRVTVTDHGIGIAAEDLPRLFQPYSRLDSVPEAKGSGLGLYISKAIVEAHGGRIAVVSQPGRGSTFSVVLPATEEAI